MATPNVGILTTAGKALIDKVNSGQAKISFSKVVFSSMDNSQLSDMQVKALTAISPQEVVVSSPETTLDTNSGETRIRATGTNEKLADGVYVKTYGVFAKDDTGNEILYGVTVSPNPNYFPAYDGVTPQAVTYSYKTVIQETSNITMTNSKDVYATQEDLTEAIATIPQPDLSGYDKTDDVDKKLQNKQDKLEYTAANDSKVVHSTPTILPSGTDLNTVTSSGYYYIPGAINKPTNADDWTIYQVVALRSSLSNGVQIAYETNGNFQSMRTWSGKGWNSWKLLATTDDVETATANMAELDSNPNFTNGLKSKGVTVATSDDLKSLEASAWRLTDLPDVPAVKGIHMLYKIDSENNLLYIVLNGKFQSLTSSDTSGLLVANLSAIVKGISGITITAADVGDSFYYPVGSSAHASKIPNFVYSGTKLMLKSPYTDAPTIIIPGGNDLSILYGSTIKYTELV
ncbi:hypothetical protein LBR_12315 [Levilactobacillus brevis]|uniref:pyocin knob domain-containing protein n=1 Tax=Levilactobacillus brevis TaxID=1580 RepID=UPI000A110598|nr:pyocin knob domain-containing protein [Levilactobacillus brevis]ORJ52890.1 hypothetical protein LBR_12315 [Levilactobacillus brevis]